MKIASLLDCMYCTVRTWEEGGGVEKRAGMGGREEGREGGGGEERGITSRGC